MKEEALTKKVSEFLIANNTRILNGRVHIQGRVIETETIKVSALSPLFFEPPLQTAQNINLEYLKQLLEYLEGYRPISRRGLIFYPSGDFSLYKGEGRLSLTMQGDGNWAQGETIDVIDLSVIDNREFDEVVEIIKQKRVSSFVFGELTDRKDNRRYSILRRYFQE